LRHRKRRAGRARSLYYWRDRTRGVDFVVESAGRLELFEAKWTELPGPGDATNLVQVRRTIGPAPVSGGGVVCRAPNGYPLDSGFQVTSIDELEN
jgi:uncharacterized protein